MTEIIEQIKKIRKGKVVGLNTGSWDIIHVGHIRFLKQLKEQCDILIVGVSSDKVHEEKYGMKAFTSQEMRQEMINGIKFVDYSFIADDKIGYSFAKDLVPDKYFYSYKDSIKTIEERDINLLNTTCKEVVKTKYAKPNITTRSLFKEIIKHELEFMFD